MFKLVKRPAYWWPVIMRQPVDGGQVKEERFELRYVRPSRTEFQERWGVDTSGFTPEQVRKHNRALFDDYVKAWKDLADEHGNPARFDDETIEQLLVEPGFVEAWSLSFVSFYQAAPEMILGNSETSPAGGPEAGDATTAEATATATSSPPNSASGEPAKST